MNNVKTAHEPLFHIAKNDSMPMWGKIVIRGGSVFLGVLVGALMCTILFGANPIGVFGDLFKGAFGKEIFTSEGLSRSTRELLQETMLLLGVGFALLPAFKMKFWNLGANGQILIGGLAAAACMYYLGGMMPSEAVLPIAAVAAILVGALWAIIPAIFKAKWNTNESLFTLMMNYIAAGMVSIFISIWVTEGSGVLKPSHLHNISLPALGETQYLPILIIALISVFMIIYIKFSKHGYELSLVGESENTARYGGIKVGKVITRTLCLSGAICGIIGFILVAGVNNTISINTAKNRGFTAIMVVWLAQYNPFMMIGTSFLIAFLSKGMSSGVMMTYNITNESVSNIVIAIVYFVILGCEFFVRYKIKFNKRKLTKELAFAGETPLETKMKDADDRHASIKTTKGKEE